MARPAPRSTRPLAAWPLAARMLAPLRLAPALLGAAALGACGSAPVASSASDVASPPPEVTASNADATSQESSEDAAGEASATGPAPVPTGCTEGRDECVPPPGWVKKLCDGVYAEVALVMFRGGTPWQRLYLRGKTRAVNASGGASVAGHLSPDEEVLVLRHRSDDPDGMQIGDGSGQYDALRWNGSCVSLEGGEVSARSPGAPRSSRIEWKWLGDAMRTALRRDDTVTQTYRARRKECRGATTGVVSKKCERLDRQLIDVIARYVRSGAELPEPEDRP